MYSIKVRGADKVQKELEEMSGFHPDPEPGMIDPRNMTPGFAAVVCGLTLGVSAVAGVSYVLVQAVSLVASAF